MKPTYKELQKINQFGSDFFPHKHGICEHPYNRPEPYNNAVIGLTSDERIACVNLIYELRGGFETIIKN